jgi:hypothetical protein
LFELTLDVNHAMYIKKTQKSLGEYKQNQTMMMMMINQKILPFAHISFHWRKEENQ